MSQFIFNGSSRMRNVTFARDHHKTGNSIIEDARRQRLRREEETRRTRAAQRVQRVGRQWLSGLAMMRRALDNVNRLPDDVARLLSLSNESAEAVAEAQLTSRLHAACWSMSYAVTHPSRIPLHGVLATATSMENEEEEEAEGRKSGTKDGSSFKSMSDVRVYQQGVLQHYGDVLCTALHRCASSSSSPQNARAPSSRWRRLLTALSSKDVSLLLYVLLQQLPHVVLRERKARGAFASSESISGIDVDNNNLVNGELLRGLIASVVDAVTVHNATFSSSLDEESSDDRASSTATYFSFLPTSPRYVDRWPAAQALTMALELTAHEPARSHGAIRTAYALALQPLLDAFPAPPPATAASTTATAAEEGVMSLLPAVSSSSSSAFAQACWQCLCADFSEDEYQMLTTNPLAVLLSSAENASAAAPAEAATPTASTTSASLGAAGCIAALVAECYARTALDVRLTGGEEVNGVKGGPLRARLLGRLVRLLPYVQHLVERATSATAPTANSNNYANATSVFAADVVKAYLLSVSCLSERLCREPFFIESILADHYAYNTGKHATLVDAVSNGATKSSGNDMKGSGGAGAASHAPRSHYRLLSSYLFSAEGGLRLLQLLTAEDEAREQLRLQVLQKPTEEAPTEASAPLADGPSAESGAEVRGAEVGRGEGDGEGEAHAGRDAEHDSSHASANTTAAAAAASPFSPASAASAATAVWPTSASAQQSPLEILCNVFAWPLFTFSKPDYSRYQQETLALCAKLVRTPQLLRRLWSLYWQSCVGLRAVLPPGPALQKLCARPVWGEGGEEKLAAAMRQQQEKSRGRRVPAAAASAPLLAALPRLPTWETHPRYPMSFYDPHPSLSIFLFTLLAHYVNVCDFADALRRGGSDAVFTTPEACALILALKEIVHRAHLYGVVPDSNGEAVAHAACQLLSRLHIVNEADSFVPPGAEGLWMSVGMVAAESAVGSIVTRWDEASAAVVEEEKAAVEEDAFSADSPTPARAAATPAATAGAPLASVSWSTTPLTAATAAAAANSATSDAVVLSRLPGDDLMFHGSRNWDNKVRYIKLLVHTPFLLPFPARALLLSSLLGLQEERWAPPSERPAVVHRGRTFVDAYDLFHDNPMSTNMYNIRFVSEDGTMEAGYGRGVYRECIVSLCKEGFAAPYGLFQQTSDGYVFPNSFSAIATSDPQHLLKIRFLGAMVGRALRDGVLQDVPFAQHFRNAILGRRNTLSNLKSFDAELYHQLMSLTHLDDAALQAVGLTFVYTVNSLGVTREVELVRGGAQMEVTPRNCLYYVHLVADFKLNREAAEQTRAFCAGLHAVLDSNRLLLFDSNEVGKLFGGDESGEIDLQDWKENTVYDKPEDANQPQVRLFWDVVESLTRKQQSQLLKFVTSMTRPPLLGFSFLSPPFKLQLLANNASGADHLPSAATCFSTLKLPPYRDYATARAKIIAAIEETGTFEYS